MKFNHKLAKPNLVFLIQRHRTEKLNERRFKDGRRPELLAKRDFDKTR